jgi:hypothetical protein
MADASTQDPPDTPTKEHGIEDPYIDLNSPCDIIEVEESENLISSRQIPQSKGKRRATPMQSSWSSKWTATGDAAAEIDRMMGEWSEMKMVWEQKQRKEVASSCGPDTVLDAMVVLNEVATEHPVMEVNYWKAAIHSKTELKPRSSLGWSLVRGRDGCLEGLTWTGDFRSYYLGGWDGTIFGRTI